LHLQGENQDAGVRHVREQSAGSLIRSFAGAVGSGTQGLAPTGKLRAAINYGNSVLAQQGPNGEAGGVSVALARALGERLGVPVELVEVHAAGKSFEALATGRADVGFIGIEAARAAEIDYSPPYVLLEGSYMVRKDSPLKAVGDVDRPGITIGVGLASVYDLFLTRTIKHATLVRAKIGGGAAGIPVFLEQKLDVAAGVRQPFEDYVREHPEMRLIPGSFQEIRQAMGTPKGRPAGVAFLRSFVEEMKASGFVAEALKRSGQAATVAPPEA
jgi:polar amino acid transport system substrate-binding protein